MAAAARPPTGDARVPCPHCGGLIHPVAGRCKHCKEDLTSLRAGRPQAATPLPSLIGSTPVPAGNYGHVAVAAVPIVVPVAREGSAPILPQRPTSQWRMKAQRPRGSLLKNWPLIVIVLAALAIVTAVVIMVLPADEKAGGKRRLSPMPAPDRMETNPTPPKSSQVDPWGNPDFAPDPDPDPGAAPRHTPDPPRQPDPNDPDDMWGGLGGGGTGGILGGSMTGTFMLTMVHSACKKLQSCPSTDQATLGAVCSQFNALPRPPVPAGCPSAQKCLDAIEKLDCTAGIDNPLGAIALIQDCSKAATEC